MKPRILPMLLACMFALSCAGCGSQGAEAPQEGSANETATSSSSASAVTGQDEGSNVADESSQALLDSENYEDVLTGIQADFAETQQKLQNERESLFGTVGDTYEGYASNVGAVQEWYDLAVSETTALSERTLVNARTYYRAVAQSINHGDDDAIDDALDEIYDVIYDDAYDDYYDALYEDAFDAMYDEYYDGILDDAYDSLPYDEWLDASSDAYDMWLDAKSDVYEGWLDGKSDLYDEWLDINCAFIYEGEFDVDEVLGLDG